MSTYYSTIFNPQILDLGACDTVKHDLFCSGYCIIWGSICKRIVKEDRNSLQLTLVTIIYKKPQNCSVQGHFNCLKPFSFCTQQKSSQSTKKKKRKPRSTHTHAFPHHTHTHSQKDKTRQKNQSAHTTLYILPIVKQIASGKQPHSTGRSAQCFVTTQRGGIGRVGGRCKREEIWGYMYMCS